jgi:hypothetical protein
MLYLRHAYAPACTNMARNRTRREPSCLTLAIIPLSACSRDALSAHAKRTSLQHTSCGDEAYTRANHQEWLGRWTKIYLCALQQFLFAKIQRLQDMSNHGSIPTWLSLLEVKMVKDSLCLAENLHRMLVAENATTIMQKITPFAHMLNSSTQIELLLSILTRAIDAAQR